MQRAKASENEMISLQNKYQALVEEHKHCFEAIGGLKAYDSPAKLNNALASLQQEKLQLLENTGTIKAEMKSLQEAYDAIKAEVLRVLSYLG